ncbi:phosphate/phosphite/phosphonate ABC transporter substrate-binding protein [Candidatus Latescibacterota bacterium]
MVINTALFTGANTQDAQAAIAVWAEVLSKRMAIGYELDFIMAPDLPSCLEAIASGEADIIGLSGIDYVHYRQELPADPMVVGVWGEERRATDQYLLLARAEDGPGDIASLAGGSLAIGTVDDGSTARMWLDVLLMREQRPTSEAYLRARSVDTSSHALLRTLFSQDDACIVTRRAYETMAELNPQVGRDLIVLAESPGYLMQMACFRRRGDPEAREALVRAVKLLHLDPQGQQILDLFRCDRAVLCGPDMLVTTEALVAEHRRLRLAHEEAEPPGRR